MFPIGREVFTSTRSTFHTGETWVEEAVSSLSNLLPFKFTAKEFDPETGLYYFGVRYYDPKLSRWVSVDPIIGEYLPVAPMGEGARKHNENLPGMGGAFNIINLNLYHYAGDNPVKIVDPDGNRIIIATHGLSSNPEVYVFQSTWKTRSFWNGKIWYAGEDPKCIGRLIDRDKSTKKELMELAKKTKLDSRYLVKLSDGSGYADLHMLILQDGELELKTATTHFVIDAAMDVSTIASIVKGAKTFKGAVTVLLEQVFKGSPSALKNIEKDKSTYDTILDSLPIVSTIRDVGSMNKSFDNVTGKENIKKAKGR